MRARRLGQSCDASTMVTSIYGNYQCCPDDTNCINEVGLNPVDTTMTAGDGVSASLTYGSSTMWLWLAALAAGVLVVANASQS